MSSEQTKQSDTTNSNSTQKQDGTSTDQDLSNMPEYLAQAPWYLPQGNKDKLQHQRKEDRDKQWDSISAHYERGKFVGQATKYRKGACKNCGSMTHTEKDCFYPPRKRGAHLTNKDIKPDEYINKELNLSYEGKRDRWNGADASAVLARQQRILQQADDKRKEQIEEINSKFQTEPDADHNRYYNTVITHEQKEREKLVDEGDQLDVHISSSDDDSDDDEPVADLNAVDTSKKNIEYDQKSKQVVRDMRIREDIAHYLLNLDDDNYDSPSFKGKQINGQYAGDDFVRASGEVPEFQKAQLFAWEASVKGSNIHLEAQPTATALLQKQAMERKKMLEEMRVKKLKSRYGIDLAKKDDAPDVITTENYVEYDRKGNVVKGVAEPIPKSKYEEDLYPGNHSSIWGSWYNREEQKWGYACCHQCVRNAYCTGEVISEYFCLLIKMISLQKNIVFCISKTCFPKYFLRQASTIPIVAKTIREDGEVNFIDIDCPDDKSLLHPLIPKTTIQHSCGGQGICGQCLINLPEDIYKRVDLPSEDEKLTIQTNFNPPKFARLACQIKPTSIFSGRTIEVFIPFE